MPHGARRRTGLVAAISIVLLITGVGTADADDVDPTPSAGATDAPAPSPADPTPSVEVPSPNVVASPIAPVVPAPLVAPAPTGGRVASSYTPAEGITFNYPYAGKKARYAIRRAVLNTVKATPSGAKIRIAAYSINDSKTVKALIAAARRGVSVQVVVNRHNLHGTPGHGSSPSFKRLRKVLGPQIYRAGVDPESVSFAKVCKKSCRGTGGNVHYKMFLFSTAGGAAGTAKQWITMTGSPNLTMLAAQGQWNHLITHSNKATYDRYALMFNEMKVDTPANPQYRDYEDILPATFFFPRVGTGNHPNEDKQLADLANVRCTGVAGGYGRDGRTLIRIGQYAWFGTRGNYLAKRVRQLWEGGCDIAVEYAVIGKTVKKILYSPKGRGRIPMRQVATFASDGAVKTYDHAKWMTVNGAYGASNGTTVIWTGTTNWTDLGFHSDDFTQVWYDNPGLDAAFRTSFARIWRGPKSHVPSPKSHMPLSNGDRVPLGKGKYAKMERD